MASARCKTGALPSALRPAPRAANDSGLELEYELSCPATALTWKSWVTIAVVSTSLVCMIAEAPMDVVLVLATVSLVLFGVIDDRQAWAGMAQLDVLAVGVLLAVGAGVRRAGTVEFLMRPLLGAPRSPAVATLRLSIIVIVFSSFLNNTPLVVMLLSVVESWAKQLHIAPRVLLMPLSFSALLGGMVTLIGSSNNMIVNTLMAGQRLPSFGMFGFTLAALPVVAAGALYLAIVAPPLLGGGHGARRAASARHSATAALTPLDEALLESQDATLPAERTPLDGVRSYDGYSVTFVVEDGGPMVGRTWSSTPLARTQLADSAMLRRRAARSEQRRSLADVDIAEAVARGGLDSGPPASALDAEQLLQAGDEITLVCSATEVATLRLEEGLLLHCDSMHLLQGPRRLRCLVEVVVGWELPMIGDSVPLAGRLWVQTLHAAPIAVKRAALPESARAGTAAARAQVPVLTAEGQWTDSRVGAGFDAGRSTAELAQRSDALLKGERAPRATGSVHFLKRQGSVPSFVRGSQHGAWKQLKRIQDPNVLHIGDTVLLEAEPTFVEDNSLNSVFLLIRPVGDSAPPRRGTRADNARRLAAGLATLLMIVAAAFRWVTLLTGALCAAVTLIATQTVTIQESYAAIKPRIMLSIVAAFGLATAMERTGVARAVASSIVRLAQPLGDFGILLFISLTTTLVSLVISNNATAVLMFPICFQAMIKSGGITPEQMFGLLIIVSSNSFVFPISYQTHLMVQAVERYSFSDFVRLGLPLGLLVAVLTPVSVLLLL